MNKYTCPSDMIHNFKTVVSVGMKSNKFLNQSIKSQKAMGSDKPN